jgi:hypothetical protein
MTDSSSVPAPGRAIPSEPASSGTNVLNQKFGPFPLWVYIAAVGVGLYAYEKHKGTSTTPKGTASGGASGTAGTMDATGAASESAVEQTLQANVGAPTTNPQWEANAESVLVGYGYPTVQVQSALNTYLAGGVLSSIQQEIVNATIAAVGAPPSPPTSSTSTGSPTTATPPTSNPTSPTTTTSNPKPATGTSGQKGFGTIDIGGKQYVILGEAGKDVYQVGGGAPVYFGSANSIAQGSAAEQHATQNGGYAYTPIEYANLVSTSPQQQSAGHF